MSVFENFPRITPFLWFDQNAEDAVALYLSVFNNSSKLDEFRTPDGKVVTITFVLDGLKFIALNGGPHYKFNYAVSFTVRCDTQQEIDDYWAKLLEGGGKEVQCGWLEDKFGLAWQIVPARLPELIRKPKAFEAMMQMKKFDIAALEQAAQE
ncbi:MAG TPA: VOC family protein [Granulicella sp.]